VKSQSLPESILKDVEAFSIKFDLPRLDKPGFLQRNFMYYRINFLREEIDELQLAVHDDDLEKAFDALIDFVYVAVGTAWLMRLPYQKGWDRVHFCNMCKERADGPNDPRSTRNSSFDVVKPIDWIPPRLKDLL